MNAPSTFHLSNSAQLAIAAAFSSRAKHGNGPGWSDSEFASNLTAWLIEERLLPAHVAPDDFRRYIATMPLAYTGG